MVEYILTNRGLKFGVANSLEISTNGIQRTSIYYCAPMRKVQTESSPNEFNLTPKLIRFNH